jgi:hypothetical protein
VGRGFGVKIKSELEKDFGPHVLDKFTTGSQINDANLPIIIPS